MKKVIFALAAFLAVSTVSVAQEQDQKGRKQGDRTEAVQKMTESMTRRYGLDEEQSGRVLELNKKYAEVLRYRAFSQRRPGGRPLRMGPNGNGQATDSIGAPRMRPANPQMEARRAERRQKMESEIKAYEDSLQVIMTPEQFEMYSKDKQMRANRVRPARKEAPGGDAKKDE